MFDVLQTFGTDRKLEEEGKEIQIGEDVFVTVARSGNRKYNTLLSKKYEESQYVLKQKNEAAEERSETIIVETMARTILLGWRGPMALAGELLPYSVANAEKLLRVKDFRVLIGKLSEDMGNFKREMLEDTAKNSVTSSGGAALGEAS